MDGRPLGLCEEGICFPSRWQFEEGTTLAMTLDFDGGTRRKVEGVVVACDQLECRLWCITVLFLDAPTDLPLARPASDRAVL